MLEPGFNSLEFAIDAAREFVTKHYFDDDEDKRLTVCKVFDDAKDIHDNYWVARVLFDGGIEIVRR